MPTTSRKIYRIRALAARFLAVASIMLIKTETDTEEKVFDWCAYIDSVPGIDHDKEWEDVKKYGDKLPQNIANMVFPEFEKCMYRW